MPRGLLDGVRVLDFTIWRPGPYATQLLSELGADVYKVEPPGGDPMRAYPGLFEALSLRKRSAVLDLKSEDGRRRALELAAQADVVIEGFRPGVAARLGIGYSDVRAVNTNVVYCSLSGMGQTGSLAQAPGHDANFQAWGGGLAPEGGVPVNGALPVADLSGGLAAAYAVCAALVHRERTGEGEYVDVAMADVIATWTGGVAPLARGVDASARGVPGYGTFATADGKYVTLGIITEDHFWSALCDALGMPDARDLSFVERMAQLAPLQARVAGAIAENERDDLVDTLLTLGVPVAPVLTRAEMLALDHFRARGVAGDGWTGHPVRFVDHPAARGTRAPAIGEHQDEGFTGTAPR
jgi:crotonobetainyl-CoA:carnitine CoA-transferase CaiB-like acyl-CoA transferase